MKNRKLHIVGLAVVAVSALFALMASSASANEWLFNGATFTGALPVITTGELLLEDMNSFIKADILCSGIFDGTIEAPNKDLISEVLTLAGTSEETTNLEGVKVKSISCTLAEKGSCEEANGSLIAVIPIHLPWPTELLLSSATLWFDDTLAGTGGNPGYEITCKAVLLGTTTDVCTGLPVANLTNGTGDIASEFEESEANNPPGNCSVGGEKQALVVGTGLIEDTTAGTLSLS